MTAYSPLGNPAWQKQYLPDKPTLLEDPVLKKIAEKYGKTSAQMAIRFQVDRGVVVIPKSVANARIEQNFDIFDIKLSDADMKTIMGMNMNLRVLTPPWQGSKYW